MKHKKKTQTNRMDAKIQSSAASTKHLNIKDGYHLKVKGWKDMFQSKGHKKQASVAILISNKVDFKSQLRRRDREGHCILIKVKSTKRTLQFLTFMHQTQGHPSCKRSNTTVYLAY